MNDEAIITLALVTAWGALLLVGSASFLACRWLYRRLIKQWLYTKMDEYAKGYLDWRDRR